MNKPKEYETPLEEELDNPEVRKKVFRAELSSTIFKGALLILASAFVILIGIGVWVIHSKQDQNSPVIANIQELSNQIHSCTDPEGQCYKDAQAQTGDAISSLSSISIYSSTCASRWLNQHPEPDPKADPYPFVFKCVQALVAAHNASSR